MKNKKTEVISFRVPVDVAKQVDKQAKKAKKLRSGFVEALFMPAFEQHINKNEKVAA